MDPNELSLLEWAGTIFIALSALGWLVCFFLLLNIAVQKIAKWLV